MRVKASAKNVVAKSDLFRPTWNHWLVLFLLPSFILNTKLRQVKWEF